MDTIVYLANQQVQVVLGNVTAKAAVIKKCYTFEAPEGSIINGTVMDTDSFVEFLKDTWAANKLPSSNIKLVINSTKFTGRNLDLPALSAKKTTEYIKREFADLGRGEGQIYGYIPIKNLENRMKKVYAEGINDEFIKDYISIFTAAGIKLKAIYSDESSMITFCANTAAKSSSTFVILVADVMTLTTILWVDGSFYYYNSTRCFHEPGTEEYAEDIARSISQLSQFMKANQIESVLENIQIAGVADEDRAMYAAAISALGIEAPVMIFKLYATASLGTSDVQKYMHGISGLYASNKSQDYLSKLKSESRTLSEEETAKSELYIRILPIGIVFIIMAAIVAGLFIEKLSLEAKYEALEAYNNDFDVMMTSAEYDRLSSRNIFLTEQFNAITEVSENIETYPCGNTEVLKIFSECAVGYAEIEHDTFDASEGTISIVAKAKNVSDINKFINRLMNQEVFSNVRYTGYTYVEEEDVWDIHVTCTLSEAAGR